MNLNSWRGRILYTAFCCLIGACVFASGYYRSENFEYSMTTSLSDTLDNGSNLLSFVIPLSSDIYKNRKAINVWAVVGSSYVAKRGAGLVDSCAMVLKTDMLGTTYGIDSVNQASLPCTLYYSALNLDTLFKRNLYITVDITDSASDTVMTLPYPVKWEIEASY